MTFAFKAQLNSTNKFVLVALCDNANDQGECYPSVSMLSSKTSLSDRAVQKSLLHLEKAGFIKRDTRRGTSTYYYISNPASWPVDTPEPRSPRTTFTPNHVHPTPERGSPPPPNVVHPTPEPRSPRIINEPSIESSGNHHKQKKPNCGDVQIPDWLPEDSWHDWVQHRKSVKAPLTHKAAELCIAKLLRLKNNGNDPVAVINQSIMSGKWTDLYEDKSSKQTRDSPASSQLGKAGQATAANAQRLIEKMRRENESTG